MRNLKRGLLAVAVLLVLIAIGSMMNRSSSSALAQGPPSGLAVSVAGPLPLPISGSTSVSGTVSAQQSGVWNVGITGAPSVNVANTPTIGLASGASVTINNPGASPVLIRDVDAVSTPVQQQASRTLGPFASEDTFAIFTVPSGKRLIIEYASLFCSLPAGQMIAGSIQTTASGTAAQHAMTASPTSAGLIPFTGVGLLVRLQADSATVVNFGIERSDSAGFARCSESFSGVLVNP